MQLFDLANQFGRRTALHDGTKEISYEDLLLASENVAACLLNGSSDLNEEIVAFAAPAGLDYVAFQWGIWRAGGIAMPLNVHATIPEIEHCIETGGVKRLFAHHSSADKLATMCEQRSIDMILADSVPAGANVKLPALDRSRRAMMIFTSGTTNKPKGVVSTHGNIAAQVETLLEAWEWQHTDSIPLFLPLHHVHGIINVLTCGLWAGARIETFENGFDMPRILKAVAKQRYSVFMAVPTIYVKLIAELRALEQSERQRACQGFSAMRLMISGSAALPARVHEQWQLLTGQVLLERYGMTEIGMALSNPLHGERRPGSVGIPLPGVQIRLVEEDGQTIAKDQQNTPGEIQVRSDTVFLEYWNNPDATAESFSDGWFRTGDMAVLERGYYRIMGRLSVDIIKSGAYKLSALEIENSLLAHPAIRECAVVGVDDTTWGEVVAVAIALEDGLSLTLAELKDWARTHVSNYKIPRRLHIVESLPRNAMGKITKADVKKLFTSAA
ncbi:MAG: acyl-CoA synthetase [Pseudomonadota bacterium]